MLKRHDESRIFPEIRMFQTFASGELECKSVWVGQHCPEVWFEEISCGLRTPTPKTALCDLPERGFIGP